MVPHTDDGRVLFAIPWHDRVIVGTTDTPGRPSARSSRGRSPRRSSSCSTHAGRYLTRDPRPADVLSDLRRPAAAARRQTGRQRDRRGSRASTRSLVSASGLVTITGGKWTTYRRMGERRRRPARAEVAGLPDRPCATAEPPAPRLARTEPPAEPLGGYGSDAPALARAARRAARLGRAAPSPPPLPRGRGRLGRPPRDGPDGRGRPRPPDPRPAPRRPGEPGAAPEVAALLAAELGRDAAWQGRQVEEYRELARGYWL